MFHVPDSAIRHYTALGLWGRQTFVDLLAASCARHPEREALVDAADRARFLGGAPRRLTYAQTWAEVRSLAACLLAQGLRKDDILCVQLPNCNELVQTYIACAMLGVIITPAPIQYREHEIGHILAMTDAKALMTFRRAEAANEALARCQALAHARAEAGRRAPLVLAWHTEAASHADALRAAEGDGHIALTPGCASAAELAALDTCLATHTVDANETFTLCWTSGTEGLPKGVPRSHNHWMIAARAIIQALALPQGAKLLNPFPLTNPGSLSGMVVPWLMTGGTLVQHQPFTLPVFLEQLRSEAIDYTCASPALLVSLLQNEQLTRGIDFKRLSRIASGAAPLSEWMMVGFAEKFGVQILNCYGASEGSALYSCAADVPDPAQRASLFPRFGVAGLAWSMDISRMLETRLVDTDTGEVITKPGRPGELRVKGPNVFHGYYNAPELNAAAFDEQGFFRTGDSFEIAGERNAFYKFVGRSKDIVIRGGFNISAAEIENLIQGHPKVREVAVIPWPDARLGEKVCAVVVPADGPPLTLDELTQWLREGARIAAYKLPEHLLLSQGLPRNPMGKVLKRELRQLIPPQATTTT